MRRLWRGAIEWLAQVGGDIRDSTDAGLLGVARFFGLLYGPIDTTLPIDQAARKAWRHRLPAHTSWRHALGGITHLLFLVLVVTGVMLAVYYRPSAQEAFPSIQHIVSGVSLGWLVRDLHVWSASLLVLVALAHMGQVFFEAGYKPPRETTWLVGIVLLFLVLAFGATGYLLAWDQSAYWTVTEALGALEEFPIVGSFLAGVLRADPIVSGATLSRFFAAHVIVLPWLTLAALAFHFAMVRRHGVAPPLRPVAPPAVGRQFFPNHLLRASMVGILVLAVAITLAILSPRPVGVAARPGELPDALISSWIVVDVSRALAVYLGRWGFALFSLLGIGLALLPLFDRGPERDLRKRPIAAAIGLTFFVAFLALWALGRNLRTIPPAADAAAPVPSQAQPADTAAAGEPQ
ncbi:MAG TPA: cytochrome b N-terminal domain-containing protein [Gemmatimonadales bacterium]